MPSDKAPSNFGRLFRRWLLLVVLSGLGLIYTAKRSTASELADPINIV